MSGPDPVTFRGDEESLDSRLKQMKALQLLLVMSQYCLSAPRGEVAQRHSCSLPNISIFVRAQSDVKALHPPFTSKKINIHS
jgi:hypothetical protein